jgi:hypothetical protein
MIIDMFKKGNEIFRSLEKKNQLIFENDTREPGEGETFTRDYVSPWFDPAKVKELWLGRCYPESAPCKDKPEYSLIIHLSNYLPIFLINLLFTNRKDAIIEDFGCGDGRLFVYLKELGFHRFSAWDNWSQIPYPIYGDMMRSIGLSPPINPRLNDPKVNPVVVNNSHAPFVFLSYGFDDRDFSPYGNEPILYQDRDISKTELVTFYSGDIWENELAPAMLPKRGFQFLCKDADDLAVAWCREDKYEEFKGKLIEYEC